MPLYNNRLLNKSQRKVRTIITPETLGAGLIVLKAPILSTVYPDLVEGPFRMGVPGLSLGLAGWIGFGSCDGSFGLSDIFKRFQ